jgi:hypothetical protein
LDLPWSEDSHSDWSHIDRQEMAFKYLSGELTVIWSLPVGCKSMGETICKETSNTDDWYVEIQSQVVKWDGTVLA